MANRRRERNRGRRSRGTPRGGVPNTRNSRNNGQNGNNFNNMFQMGGNNNANTNFGFQGQTNNFNSGFGSGQNSGFNFGGTTNTGGFTGGGGDPNLGVDLSNYDFDPNKNSGGSGDGAGDIFSLGLNTQSNDVPDFLSDTKLSGGDDIFSSENTNDTGSFNTGFDVKNFGITNTNSQNTGFGTQYPSTFQFDGSSNFDVGGGNQSDRLSELKHLLRIYDGQKFEKELIEEIRSSGINGGTGGLKSSFSDLTEDKDPEKDDKEKDEFKEEILDLTNQLKKKPKNEETKKKRKRENDDLLMVKKRKKPRRTRAYYNVKNLISKDKLSHKRKKARDILQLKIKKSSLRKLFSDI